MALTETGDYPQARHMLLSSRPLTDEERAAIAAELTTDQAGRGYKGQDGAFKGAAELFGLLNDSYAIANPEPQSRVPRATCTLDELKLYLIGPRAKALLSPNPAIQGKWAALSAGLLPLVTEPVILGSVTMGQINGLMLSDGLITQPEVDAFLSMPDTAYQSVLSMRPRGIEIAGVVVELGEVVSIVAGIG